FPGGACEPIDEDLAATALRETDEEIGVPPHLVRVLGALDDFPTITHFVVTPFVGVVPHPLTYRLNRYEVESVVEVPLSFFTDPSGLRIEQREHEGQIFDVLFWDYGPHTIWGATARILKGFLELIA
ncbi:MAG: NUDIX hydrolase, partial [Anaerolineae bacterium]